MFDKLESIEKRYLEVLDELGQPDAAGDQNRFKKLMKENKQIDEYSDTLARRYIEEMLICLIRHGMRHEHTDKDVYTNIMHSAMQHINESYSMPISLK